MPQFADRVKVTSTSTGTSAITLSSSAVSGYQAFPSSLDGETVGYVIESGSAWEIGTGTYTHSTLNLTRSLRSSSTGSLLSLASGTHTVFLTPAYQDIQIVEAFSSTSDLPSASDNHGRVYHVHGEGALYFAHSGSWVKVANYSDITTYTHPNHSGEVTSTGDGATVIADDVVDEANLKVSNSPTDGYVLTARSGNTGGMTWEAASGGGSSTSALTETTFSATANQTAFPVSGGITNAANISVFQNGVKLEEGASKDYTASASTNTVTLNSGAAAGDVVEVLEYGQPNSITDLSDTPSSLGTAGQVLQVNSGATALEFADASSGSGVTVYTGLSGTDGTPSGATYLLNASSPSAGDLAYVSSNTSLYQNNGNGWYRIAVINTTPTISSVADASSNTTPFTLEGGTNTVITVTASDADEGTDLTYSHSVTSGSLNGTTVTQGTGANENVFTIAPHASNATTFSITFTVSDSINAATSVAAFTLEFVITDSHTTSLLMATDGSAGDNSTITYDTGSSTNNSLTVNGDAHAGTFSPYRHGGYSVEFVDEGSNGYGLQLPAATFNNPSTTFTIEAWVYLKSYSNNATGHYNRAIMGKGATYLNFGVTSDYTVQLYHYDGTARYPKSTGTVPLNEWTHVCAKVDSGSITFYINGTASGTGTWYGLHSGHVNTDFYVGMTSDTNGNADKWWDGYLSNVRFVDGTAITPSSGGNEALDPATTNTEFLLCASNRFIDSKSTSPLTVTPYRTPKIVPIAPYDYQQYSASTNGGSVYFDGSDYLQLSATATDLLPETSSTTIEAWVNTTGTGHVSVFSNFNPSSPYNGMEVGLYNGYQTIYSQASWINNTGGTGVSTINDGSWHHLAWVITNSGATVTTYVDGVQNYTSSINASTTGSSNQRIGASSNSTVNRHFTGYISDVRFVKGTAVYSGAFTPPTGTLTTTGGTYPSTTNVDTSITASNTSLLLSGTDAHVIDKSQGSNLELFGTAAAVTSASSPTPPNNTNISSQNSIFLDGNSDYVIGTVPDMSGTWTVEFWAYGTSAGSQQSMVSFNSGGVSGINISRTNSNYLMVDDGVNAQSAFTGAAISSSAWSHFAIVRNGTTTTGYINGSSVGSHSFTPSTVNSVLVGRYNSSPSYYFSGYIQDLRVSIGKARYTSNFTVPSSPLKG